MALISSISSGFARSFDCVISTHGREKIRLFKVFYSRSVVQILAIPCKVLG